MVDEALIAYSDSKGHDLSEMYDDIQLNTKSIVDLNSRVEEGESKYLPAFIKDNEGNPIAGHISEEAIYDQNGVRLKNKLENIDEKFTEFVGQVSEPHISSRYEVCFCFCYQDAYGSSRT